MCMNIVNEYCDAILITLRIIKVQRDSANCQAFVHK